MNLEEDTLTDDESNYEFEVKEEVDSVGGDSACVNPEFLPDDVDEAVHEEIARVDLKIKYYSK